MTRHLCSHLRRQMGRVIFADGSVHVREQCLECGANPRGPGAWVGRSELRVPLEDLPLLDDRRGREPGPGERQRGLFDAME
jgi:hypothetical protein